ncbi:hypothetical protein BURC_03479 [Burkholderiaceae bacterium]|nr:hypothetical protein BURC_03479 [Burkholderiaceae bacterium]
MNKVPNVPWWASKGLTNPDAAPDTDYADMGTAFGLDASLGPTSDCEPPSTGDAGPSTDRLNRRSVL